MSTIRSQRPRVLIVEPDAILAMGLVRECTRLGLEPKLCRGPSHTSSCPALAGERCERPERVEATFMAVTTGDERRVAPYCRGGKLVVAGERPWVGAHTVGALGADSVLEYPYDPRDAAAVLFWLIRGERIQRASTASREPALVRP